MTKRDLIVWLKETAENVIDDISSKKDKALEAYEEKVIEEIELDDIANEIQKKFTEIDEMVRTWKSEINSDYQDIVLRDDYYGGVQLATVFTAISMNQPQPNILCSIEI